MNNTNNSTNICFVFSQQTLDIAIDEWIDEESKGKPKKKEAYQITKAALPWFMRHLNQSGSIYMFSSDDMKIEIETWKKRFRKTRVCFSVPQWNCTIRARASDSVDKSLAHPVYHDFPCPQPYHFLMIRYDGVCGMCCGDDYGEFKLGNAFDTPIRDLYWSPERMAIARTLSRPGGRKKVGSPCASCLEGTVSAHLMQDA